MKFLLMNRLRKLLFCSFLVIVVLLAVFWGARRVREAPPSMGGPGAPPRTQIRFGGTKWIEPLSFTALATNQTFFSTVISTHTGTWVQSQSTNHNWSRSAPTLVEYVSIRVRRDDGTELLIYQEAPDSNDLRFVSSLHDGQKCRLPDDLLTWLRLRGLGSK
jgi:hypothetical protein